MSDSFKSYETLLREEDLAEQGHQEYVEQVDIVFWGLVYKYFDWLRMVTSKEMQDSMLERMMKCAEEIVIDKKHKENFVKQNPPLEPRW